MTSENFYPDTTNEPDYGFAHFEDDEEFEEDLDDDGIESVEYEIVEDEFGFEIVQRF